MAEKKEKEVVNTVKLQIPAGKANPSPPVGPALGQAGLNIMEFCTAFNEKTKQLNGPIPVVISIFKDRSYDFVTKLPPTSYLIQQKLKLKKGSSAPGQETAGVIKMSQVREIAEEKMQDLNAHDIEAAARMVAGTAVSMGLEVNEAA